MLNSCRSFYTILVGVFIRWFKVIPVKQEPMSTGFKIHVQILSTFHSLDWSYSCETMGPGSWIYAQILLMFYTLDLGYSCEKGLHRYVIQDLCSNFVNIPFFGLRQLLWNKIPWVQDRRFMFRFCECFILWISVTYGKQDPIGIWSWIQVQILLDRVLKIT